METDQDWRNADSIGDHENKLIFKKYPFDLFREEKNERLCTLWRQLCSLKHPNILTYHEYNVTFGMHNVCMENMSGPTLHSVLQELRTRQVFFHEQEVLRIFCQTSDAVNFLYQQNIACFLHSGNIVFDLNRKVLKICNFESEVSSYFRREEEYHLYEFVAPEVVEGKKSQGVKDYVWKLGLILYELMMLKRPFSGETMSSSLRKIICCSYPQILDAYSEEIKSLVNAMLVKDPTQRLDLKNLLATPLVVNTLCDLQTDIGRLHLNTPKNESIDIFGFIVCKFMVPESFFNGDFKEPEVQRTNLSKIYYWKNGENGFSVSTVSCDDADIVEVGCGSNDMYALTSCGKLMKMTKETSNNEDEDENKDGKDIKDVNLKLCTDGVLSSLYVENVCCGDDVTVIKTAEGKIFTWGDGKNGCIGNGARTDFIYPCLVKTLVGYYVKQVSCVFAHVMALTDNDEVYMWGKGEHGNLGLKDRNDYLIPTLVTLPNTIKPKYIFTGSDCSFIISRDGFTYACGNNRNNKLGLWTTSPSWDSHETTELVCIYDSFTAITCKQLSEFKMINIAAGPSHSAFVTETLMLFTVGLNNNLQLGYPPSEVQNYQPRVVDVVSEPGVKYVACGETFTLAITYDNKMYVWGGFECSQPRIQMFQGKVAFRYVSAYGDAAVVTGKGSG